MECILVENFNGMKNYLGHMRSYLTSLVHEAKKRSTSRNNHISTMIEEIKEKMNRLMTNMHGLVRTLELVDQHTTASPWN